MGMTRTGKLWRFAGATLAAWLGLVMAAPGTASGQTAVDLELVLAIDCSYSVDAGEFELQKKGLALAFQNHQKKNNMADASREIFAKVT